MKGTLRTRRLTPEDREAVARLIHRSTNSYYASIGRPPIFSGVELSTLPFFDVYQRLDPGEGLVVEDGSGQIVGSCFVHPRETHLSLGIMNVHPDHFGQGIAKQLIRQIIDEAGNLPVRLVSSCLNLDSFSLYTSAGFTPFCAYQDLQIKVPEGGLEVDPPGAGRIREAEPADVEAIAQLERSVSGISRARDYRYFIENPDGLWRLLLIENRSGELAGYLGSCSSGACNMLGPGVARTEDQAADLIHAQLAFHRGRSPVVLVPVQCGALVRQLYRWGARNVELHFGQSYGPAKAPEGVTLPTFLPESG